MIDGKVWELTNAIGHFEAMDYILVRGQVTSYQGSNQLNIQQIRKADPAIDILLVSPIELGEDVWKPGFDPEFDQHSVKVSKQLKQTYLKIAWKYGCDFLAASDVAKPSKADMEHMNEKGHKNLAKAIESFLVEKERNHSNNYVNVV